MKAKYKFFRYTPNPWKEGMEKQFYPRLVDMKKVPISEFFKLISGSTTFSEADLRGAMSAITHYFTEALLEGNKIHWEGVGTFHIILACDPVTHPREIRAESIRASRISFKPDATMKRAMKSMEVESAGPYEEPVKYSAEEREERIVWYLEKNDTITSGDCMAINSCSRRTAQADLASLRKKELIRMIGAKKASLYILVKTNS